MSPIENTCYRCVTCVQCHLCENCFNEGLHSQHNFVAIDKPNGQPRIVSRVQLPSSMIEILQTRDLTDEDYQTLLLLDVPQTSLNLITTNALEQGFPAVLLHRQHPLLRDCLDCGICQSRMEGGDRVRTLHCRHTFHTKCIDPYVTTQKSCCPLDGMSVIDSSTFQRKKPRSDVRRAKKKHSTSSHVRQISEPEMPFLSIDATRSNSHAITRGTRPSLRHGRTTGNRNAGIVMRRDANTFGVSPDISLGVEGRRADSSSLADISSRLPMITATPRSSRNNTSINALQRRTTGLTLSRSTASRRLPSRAQAQAQAQGSHSFPQLQIFGIS